MRTTGWIFGMLLGLASTGEGREQMVVSVAGGWDSSRGKLQLFERKGRGWEPVSQVVPVLYGKNGLAWGRGLEGAGEAGPQKVEGDKRAPAGVFAIGKIFTFDNELPEGTDYPFWTITKGCAWIDDPSHPQYNRHVTVDPKNPPAWFDKQKMRHNDPPHRWLVEIRHNADPPIPGAGSAIFFHIRRGVNRPSAGCTVMAGADLVTMIRWLRADARPRYALLPAADYLRLWKHWDLPSPQAASALLTQEPSPQ